MLFQSSLAVFGLATLAQSHMIMNTPIPFGKSSLTNAPLIDGGSDFPCKQRAGVYDAEGANNQMALGSEQPLSFTGSAVHGGGSCQISITYDKEPTVNSVWKVIHSIEGGCPMRDIAGNNGNDANQISPSKYSFTVPSDIPAGQAVLAWSWFNRVGNREMYMNCAPITLTGGSTKRDEDLSARNVTQLVTRDTAAYDALPDMVVANINECKVPEGKNLVFPNPGSSVEKNGLIDGTDGNTITPSCIGSAPAGGSAPAPSSAASQPTKAPAASSSAALPGGVFVTVPVPGNSDPAPTAAPSAPAASSVASAPVKAPSAAPAPVPAPSQPEAPVGTGTSGSGSALTGACSPEGQWNCIGGSSFQRCASGAWSAVQQLAAGTTCASGESSAINISAISKEKRAVRFSHEHIRRHLRSS